MKTKKLPFNISLERKYNEVNAEDFVNDWTETKNQRKNRIIAIDNELHIELGKFKTFGISIHEVIDIGMRYALCKQEFKRMTKQIINRKEEKI